jgi:hypothetical protein
MTGLYIECEARSVLFAFPRVVDRFPHVLLHLADVLFSMASRLLAHVTCDFASYLLDLAFDFALRTEVNRWDKPQ